MSAGFVAGTTQKEDTLQALLITPIWFLALGVAYWFLRKNPEHKQRRLEFKIAVAAENKALAASRVE